MVTERGEVVSEIRSCGDVLEALARLEPAGENILTELLPWARSSSGGTPRRRCMMVAFVLRDGAVQQIVSPA